MYELKVTATKVMGTCTATPAVAPQDHFFIRNGDIRIPNGGFICIWALQAMLPLIPSKERESGEPRDQDWMRRVHHVQCPDPDGRVIYKIERMGKIEKTDEVTKPCDVDLNRAPPRTPEPMSSIDGGVRSLRVIVQEVRGKCTSGMKPGDYFCLQSGRIYIPAGGHFCLYALSTTLPLLPAMQRPLAEGDWMKAAQQVICPDPAGNVIMGIAPISD
ncbi:MAG: TIGR04076 family protein [Myxococcota bacterium]|nr:TIGR04076 family protein [Myxococcota bacterium]